MNVVLVGGAGDGGRIVLQDGITRYDLAVYKGPMTLDISEPLGPVPYETQHYNLFRLHPVTRAVVFAHEDLTPTDVMERLLDGYAPKSKEIEAARQRLHSTCIKCDGNHGGPRCANPECWNQ